MKTIKELELGFSDAQNYAQRQNKTMFNEVFVRNTFLDDLVKQSSFFLVGEKGTGKTAYATYLCNNNYKDVSATISFLSATDYEKFYTLKQQKNLDLTGYEGIWKVILLLLISKSITENDKVLPAFSKSGINNILAAIDDYYMNAFSPEITNVMKVVDIFTFLIGKRIVLTYHLKFLLAKILPIVFIMVCIKKLGLEDID